MSLNAIFLVGKNIIAKTTDPTALTATSPNLGEEYKKKEKYCPPKLGGRAKRRGYVKAYG
jgi:hypothetical protein